MIHSSARNWYFSRPKWAFGLISIALAISSRAAFTSSILVRSAPCLTHRWTRNVPRFAW